MFQKIKSNKDQYAFKLFNKMKKIHDLIKNHNYINVNENF